MSVFKSKQRITLKKMSQFSILATVFTHSQFSFAVAPIKHKKSIGFQFSPQNFRSDVNIPLAVSNRLVALPKKNIDERLKKYALDSRIEPLQLTVDPREDLIIDLSRTIALPSQSIALATFIKNNFAHGEEIPGTDLRLVSLDSEAMKLIDKNSFANLFEKTHYKIEIPTKFLKENIGQRELLIRQLGPFFKSTEIANIRKKITTQAALSMDKDLLPAFGRIAVGHHTLFKGPNCFHAALSFQSPLLSSSSFINVRNEQGYHKNMLNYDELWRALKLSFYEVDPANTPLQYGDMIVLFEVDKVSLGGDVDFKTLRHAATYLMGGYVFAKGSKSANSPYVIRTLAEEWETWTKYTVTLGAKVYRRNLNNVTNRAPTDPQDWVY